MSSIEGVAYLWVQPIHELLWYLKMKHAVLFEQPKLPVSVNLLQTLLLSCRAGAVAMSQSEMRTNEIFSLVLWHGSLIV